MANGDKFPRTHADGEQKNRHGADSNLAVETARHQAATTAPGQDTSAQNAQRAKREKWTDGRLGGQHTPGQ